MQKIIAVDWGAKRLGLARANTIARLAEPAGTITNDAFLIDKLSDFMKSEQASLVVVGLPRNLSGEETPQSQEIRQFALNLSEALQCQVVLQDETLTSHLSKELLDRFPKADKDSLSAAIILEDYLNTL